MVESEDSGESQGALLGERGLGPICSWEPHGRRPPLGQGRATCRAPETLPPRARVGGRSCLNGGAPLGLASSWGLSEEMVGKAHGPGCQRHCS